MGTSLSTALDADKGLKLYLRPLGIAQGPGGLALPLAGRPLSFNTIELILRAGGRRVYEGAFPVAGLDALKGQLPRALANRFDEILARLCAPRPAIGPLDFSKPLVMGILNVTPDSFSDGGDYFSAKDAKARASELFKEGADIVDAGAESTRPGAKPVPEAEEKKRLRPVLDVIKELPGPVSIDTRKSPVMIDAIKSGATLINDVSALTFDKDAMTAVKGAPGIVLMHAKGSPETMQKDPSYEDVVLEVYDFLEARIAACQAKGIARGRLIVDPGIGFGKSVDHNLALLRNLAIFHGLGVPLLIGVSRKRFVGAITGVEDAKQRLGGSLAAGLFALQQGAQILRVHDVRETRQACDVFCALRADF